MWKNVRFSWFGVCDDYMAIIDILLSWNGRTEYVTRSWFETGQFMAILKRMNRMGRWAHSAPIAYPDDNRGYNLVVLDNVSHAFVEFTYDAGERHFYSSVRRPGRRRLVRSMACSCFQASIFA